ncbi:MAG: transcription antitermination factor NusB [Egibacteraceae bacterium]
MAPGEGPPAGTTGGRGSKPLSRRAARRRALEILYEADLRERGFREVLDVHVRGDDPPSEFTVELVSGVDDHRAELDEVIRAHAHDWRLERMPVIDRNLLRMGLHQILHRPDIPTAVAIDEAVELAKEFSTDDSARFVNGLLSRAAPQA